MPNSVSSGTMPGTSQMISIDSFDKKQLRNRAHSLWKRNEKLYIKEHVPASRVEWLLGQWRILTAKDPVGQDRCQQKLFVPREDGGYDEYDARGNLVN